MRNAVLVIMALAALARPGLAQDARGLGADELAALGAASHEARDPRAALIHFQAALAVDSMHYLANWQGALALIDIAQEVPENVRSAPRDSLYALAEVYAERIRLAATIRSEALRAIELRPGHDGAYHVLGRWNAEIMRLSGIQKFFARTFLGARIFNEASWEGATSNLEKAVELNPRRPFHRLDLATVYIDRHRYADARAQLEEVIRLPPLDYGDEDHQRKAAALLRSIEGRADD
jgi:FimV-like protein